MLLATGALTSAGAAARYATVAKRLKVRAAISADAAAVLIGGSFP